MTPSDDRIGGVATAEQMLDVLERHHVDDNRNPRAGVWCTEVPDPEGTRRADALWVPNAITSRTGIIGYEVKVTRADLMAELRDPSKADAWSRYCRRWWLAVPDFRIVDGLEVPEHWGICGPPARVNGRTLTVLREAPALTPQDTGPAYHRIMLHAMRQYHDRQGVIARRLTLARREADDLRRELAARPAAASRDAEALGKILEAVRAAGVHTWRDAPDAIVEAAVDLAGARANAERLRVALASVSPTLDRFAGRFADLAGELRDVEAVG